jgi:hypothetical protein
LALELKYGSSVEVVPMDRVSNVDFNEVGEVKDSLESYHSKVIFRGKLIVSRSPGRVLASNCQRSVI